MNLAFEKYNDITSLAVGNSHSCAIDFKELGFKGLRIAEGGNDLFEVHHQLEFLIDMMPKLKVVFLNISYFSFFNDNSIFPVNNIFVSTENYDKISALNTNKRVLDFFEKRENYYTITLNNKEKLVSESSKVKINNFLTKLHQEQDRSSVRKELYISIYDNSWIKGDFFNFIFGRTKWAVSFENWLRSIKFILNDRYDYRSTFIDTFGQFSNDRANSSMSDDSLKIFAKYSSIPYYSFVEETVRKKKPIIHSENFDILEKIINLLSDNEIRLVLYSPPFHYYFQNNYNKQSRIEVKKIITKLKKNYSIEYYDFSNDVQFIFDNSLFHDSDHLNRDGATKFSKKFKMYLK